MTRKQGPILSRMVPQCVVSVQIGVKNFPCGPKTLQKRAAKGLKIGGHGCNINIYINKFSPDPPTAGPFVLASRVWLGAGGGG
jgi:hypothetical protein